MILTDLNTYIEHNIRVPASKSGFLRISTRPNERTRQEQLLQILATSSSFPVTSVIIPATIDPTSPIEISNVTDSPEKSFEYPREHINCSI